MIPNKLVPGMLVRLICTHPDPSFFIAGKDPIKRESYYPVAEGKIGLHVRTRLSREGSNLNVEEVLFDDVIVSLADFYLEPVDPAIFSI